jgi:hypothetical protein
MNGLAHELHWRPLPGRSSKRVNWDEIFRPLEGVFHMGSAGAEADDCPPQRLASLRTRAAEALATTDASFTGEADRLRRERNLVLGVALIVTLLIIFLTRFDTNHWYDLVKAVLATGGTGGLLTWTVTFAFRRIDQESQLRLFPKFFAPQFNLCSTCKQFEEVFERFVRAAETFRGGKTG